VTTENDPSNKQLSVAGRAMVLAWAAVLLDVLALATGLVAASGLLEFALVTWGVTGLAVPVCAGAAALCAIASLGRGRDNYGMAWLALAVAAWGAYRIFKWVGETMP
jgi:hypothetical protein